LVRCVTALGHVLPTIDARLRVSHWTCILVVPKATIRTAAAWIVIVNKISDRPQSQLGLPKISIERLFKNQIIAAISAASLCAEDGMSAEGCRRR
jgi:hypothetical protein